MVKFTVLLVAIVYFCIFAAMNVAEVILVLVALAFAFGCFVAAVVRSRASEAQVERWKRYAERWNAYRAEVRAEKKRLKAAEKACRRGFGESPLPWQRHSAYVSRRQARKARKAYIRAVREQMFWKSIFGA